MMQRMNEVDAVKVPWFEVEVSTGERRPLESGGVSCCGDLSGGGGGGGGRELNEGLDKLSSVGVGGRFSLVMRVVIRVQVSWASSQSAAPGLRRHATTTTSGPNPSSHLAGDNFQHPHTHRASPQTRARQRRHIQA